MLTHLERVVQAGVSWSPDGEKIAFSMFVPDVINPFAEMPSKPEGADWAPSAKTYERLIYRADGAGFLPLGHSQIFVLPVEGGTPRQLTDGPYDHGGGLEWTPDSQYLIVSANRREDWEYHASDSEIYEIEIAERCSAPAHGSSRAGWWTSIVARWPKDRLPRV